MTTTAAPPESKLADAEPEPDTYADVRAAFEDAPKRKRAKPEPPPVYETEAAKFTAEEMARPDSYWEDEDASEIDHIAEAIRDQCNNMAHSLRSALASAWKAGALLTEAKAQVSHGEWLPWLAANVSISERTAQAWMQFATLTLAEAEAHGSIAAALAALAGPSTKSAATADLLDRINAERALAQDRYRTAREDFAQREATARAGRAAERAKDSTPYRPTAAERAAEKVQRAEFARQVAAGAAADRATSKVEPLLAKAISTVEPHERAAFFDKACVMLDKHGLVVRVTSRVMPFRRLW